MPRLGSVNEKVFCASRIDENISLTEGITAWLSSGNEGIYLGSILYRISVSKLINSTQYVFFLLWLNWQQFSHAEETAKGRYRSTKNG